MTPHELCSTAEAVWTRLQNSPVGHTLANGCRDELLGKHLEFPKRTREVITTIELEYGEKGGWFSLWQAGGGLKAIVWVPPLLYRMLDVRTDVQEIQRGMSGILRLSEVQLRVIEPEKMELWLRSKGWPLLNGSCTGR